MKLMRYEKKILLGALILSIFVFIVAFSSLYIQIHISEGNVCGCAIPITLFVPFIASVGLFIGTLLYHLLLKENKCIDYNMFLNIFDSQEREVLKKLIDCRGSCLQSKLTRDTNLSKVQVFIKSRPE